MNGTAEVQVTIVNTVTVPLTAEGNWLHSDAIAAAASRALAGFGHYDARRVDDTGAPGLIDEPVPADVDQVTRDLAALEGQERTAGDVAMLANDRR